MSSRKRSIGDVNSPRGNEIFYGQNRSLSRAHGIGASSVNEEADIVETDGRIYENQRNSPGQKCHYILPGDTFKESYRLSTFIKFSEEIPVDVSALASHGFFYTGYKDRVKCFSCGSNVLDWKDFDDPRDAKWHFNQCKLVLGIETKNQRINMHKEIVFIGVFTSTVHSLDRGYDAMSTNGTSSGPKELSMTQNTRLGASPFDATKPTALATPESNPRAMIQSDTAVLPHPTAGAVYPETNRPPNVEGLVFASIQSSYHLELLTKTLNLHREEDRRKSFFGWRCFFPSVTPDLLAKVGFFYLGDADRVQCFSCCGVLRNWKEGDDVDQQHRTHFPYCKMVLRTERRNIPLPNSLRKAAVRKPPAPVEPADPSPQELESLKRQFPCSFPVNPHMRNFEDRLLTFDHRWPKQNVNASPRHIAKAGFFFLGDRDRAKCWYCNGGLQNWEPNDEPFTEHAKWFPGCEYILQCKGVDFVKRNVAKTPNLNRPTLRHPRFDHRTGKLVSVNVHPDQQQPVIIDPGANVSSVLQNPPTSSSSSGQKCHYILPGDTFKESYRLSTFFKFPEEIPVDVCVLASHGFFYTGYKDRVKCFSCGSSVLDWKVDDDPRDAKCHFDQCKLVLGTETNNQRINMNKEIVFIGVFPSTVQCLDDDHDPRTLSNEAFSGCKELFMPQNARLVASPFDAMKPAALVTPESNPRAMIQSDAAVPPHPTAGAVYPETNRPPKVEGVSSRSSDTNRTPERPAPPLSTSATTDSSETPPVTGQRQQHSIKVVQRGNNNTVNIGGAGHDIRYSSPPMAAPESDDVDAEERMLPGQPPDIDVEQIGDENKVIIGAQRPATPQRDPSDDQ